MGTEAVGTASVAYSQDELDKQLKLRLREVKRRFIQVTLVVTPLAIGFSLWVASSWTRPIQQFVALTQKIGQGRWDVDLNRVSRRGDELGRLGRSLKNMATQLHELDQMKDDFISVVTHELRSPLGAIESYLHLIAEELEQGKPVEWDIYLERLRLNTQRLNRFVTDLLDVAALERGKVTLQLQRVDLRALAQDVLHLFDVQCREKPLQCRLEVLDPNIWVRIDPDKIRQVLINLIANAVKFTPSDGVITLTIESLQDEEHVLVQVKDTGIGIALTDQTKIFDKFEQVASARRHVQSAKGTGLGLAICRSLIELHGHELGVRSQLGQGSAFFFKVNRAAHV
jgi:signal transduction histidine kinase